MTYCFGSCFSLTLILLWSNRALVSNVYELTQKRFRNLATPLTLPHT